MKSGYGIEVSVTQEDIDKGRRKSPKKCPVALALFREVSWGLSKVDPHVTLRRLSIDPLCIRTPEEVKNFISDFDERREVKPFKFKF